MNKQPIGILDSGVGGLSIWKEIITQLPGESTLYIGDSLNAPYGSKSIEEIRQLSYKLVDYLLDQEVKVIVIACNTITVTCLDKLRKDYPHISFIGTVPVIKTAAEMSISKKIGILSTPTTAESAYQKNLLLRYALDCTVTVIGTDVLVPLIESEDPNDNKFQEILPNLLHPFKVNSIDTLVLGCSHFPLIKSNIQACLGKNVRILDSALAIGRQVRRVLETNNALALDGVVSHSVNTTGNKSVLYKIVQNLADNPNTIQVSKVSIH